MREIIFRGKREDNGEWVCGAYYKELSNYYILHPINAFVPVIPETVGQYTGLKDKNGKQIYEGDIVKSNYKAGNLVVYFVHGCFRLTYSKKLIGTGLEIFFNEELQIIGNIYENQELLEKE